MWSSLVGPAIRDIVIAALEKTMQLSLIHSASQSQPIIIIQVKSHRTLSSSLEAKYSVNIPLPLPLALVYHSFYLLNNVWITSTNWYWQQLAVTY